jgi:hypothetical protein
MEPVLNIFLLPIWLPVDEIKIRFTIFVAADRFFRVVELSYYRLYSEIYRSLIMATDNFRRNLTVYGQVSNNGNQGIYRFLIKRTNFYFIFYQFEEFENGMSV